MTEPARTIARALADGWIWLHVRCEECRHSTKPRLEDFTIRQGAMPVTRIADRFRCKACGGRKVVVMIGRWEMTGGQPFPCEVELTNWANGT